MKVFNVILFTAVCMGILLGGNPVGAQDGNRAVKIIKPAHKATVSNPVEICMEVYGLEVEPASKGVRDGAGHHHLLVDVNIPSSVGMAKPLAKDARYIHMGDGSSCKTLNLSSGKRFIRALFAKGNHVPYDPAITDTIVITVK